MVESVWLMMNVPFDRFVLLVIFYRKIHHESSFFSVQVDYTIYDWIKYGNLEEADAVYVTIFKMCLENLCDSGDQEALEWYSYAHYGAGEYPYHQDWHEAKDGLLRLMDIKPSGLYANTLGNMYYYGRVNNGVPEYDKAFKYFSIGAAAGSYESKYKQADMFLNGHGVPKSVEIAEEIISQLYDINVRDILKENFDSSFPDVAFCMGNIYRKKEKYDLAVYFFLQAQYGIQKRMQVTHQDGDQIISQRISKVLNEMLTKSCYLSKGKHSTPLDIGDIIKETSNFGCRWAMKIEILENERYKLNIRILPKGDVKQNFFLTLPRYGYCGHCPELNAHMLLPKVVEFPDTDQPIIFDDVENGRYYLYGQEVAHIEGVYFIDAPEEELDK